MYEPTHVLTKYTEQHTGSSLQGSSFSMSGLTLPGTAATPLAGLPTASLYAAATVSYVENPTLGLGQLPHGTFCRQSSPEIDSPRPHRRWTSPEGKKWRRHPGGQSYGLQNAVGTQGIYIEETHTPMDAANGAQAFGPGGERGRKAANREMQKHLDVEWNAGFLSLAAKPNPAIPETAPSLRTCVPTVLRYSAEPDGHIENLALSRESPTHGIFLRQVGQYIAGLSTGDVLYSPANTTDRPSAPA